MAVLFRYELKKIFGRKLVWLALAAIAAMIVWVNRGMVMVRSSGEVDGFRAAYRLYEGQILTDSVSSDAKEALQRYIADNPDAFEAYEAVEGESLEYFPKGYGYASGFWEGLTNISQSTTLEAADKEKEEYKKQLDEGRNANGDPLSPRARWFAEMTLTQLQEQVAVHYAEGWRVLTYSVQFSGYFILAMLALGLVTLFSGESAARAEGVMLCAAKRGRAAAAKLLAAVCYALVVTAAILGPYYLMTALTYGLDGGQWPSVTLRGWLSVLPGVSIGSVFCISAAITAVSASACAAVVALASSFFRHPLSALAGAVGALGVLFVPYAIGEAFMYTDSLIWLYFAAYSTFLPTPALIDGSMFFDSLSGINTWIIGLLIPAAVGGLACFLAPRRFLRRRKA